MRFRPAERGFTLLETTIALIVFAAAAALLAESGWAGARRAREAWVETVALRLAQSVAERQAVDTAPLAGTPDPDFSHPDLRLSIVPEGGGGSRVLVASGNSGKILATVVTLPLPVPPP